MGQRGQEAGRRRKHCSLNKCIWTLPLCPFAGCAPSLVIGHFNGVDRSAAVSRATFDSDVNLARPYRSAIGRWDCIYQDCTSQSVVGCRVVSEKCKEKFSIFTKKDNI